MMEKRGEKMPVMIRNIICEFAEDMQKLFVNQLSSVVVYGSYARGDYTETSDVDIMLIVKISENEIRNYLDQVSDQAFEYLMKYGIQISPVIKNENHFKYWMDNLPYYRNVKNEGVIVYAG